VKVSDFHYTLPSERIAQEPVSPRDAARLLVHRVSADSSRHRRVRELGAELEAGDLLVLNDTRVLPARLFARRGSGGVVELLFLEPVAGGGWRALVRPAKKLRPGEELSIDGGLLARAVEREGEGPTWIVEFADPEAPERSVVELLEEAGRMPLPPYIGRDREGDPRDPTDRRRYQTVYAREPGAVAAPTAGLHFTAELLEALEARGIERATVTLHVGLGTFQPVSVEEVDEHEMHAESYRLDAEAAGAITRCRARGGRVVAVGTTSVRVLESCADAGGKLSPGSGRTRLFIHPGYRFRVIDGLLTNFHLPASTLLMLVSAFAGRERVLELYAQALRRDYRFYSYGDAMLLLP